MMSLSVLRAKAVTMTSYAASSIKLRRKIRQLRRSAAAYERADASHDAKGDTNRYANHRANHRVDRAKCRERRR